MSALFGAECRVAGSDHGTSNTPRPKALAPNARRVAPVLLLAIVLGLAGSVRAEVTIRFLDVGQGDSILVTTDDNKVMLLDGGGLEAGPIVTAWLKELEIDKIDLLITSHPHLDHIGGVVSVLRTTKIGTYLDSGIPHTTETYKKMASLVVAKKIRSVKARAGRKIRLGKQVELEILGPRDPLLKDTRSDLNANSVIVHLKVGTVDLLLLGDSEPDTLDRLLADGLPSIEILKIGHHGSRWGTSRALLDATRPRVAVISCGRSNRFGHPHNNTLAALQDADVQIYRTDLQGTIVVTTDGKGFAISTIPTKDKFLKLLRTSVADHAGLLPAQKIVTGGTGVFYASRRSRVFHPEGCVHLTRIKSQNLVQFVSREEALRTGRRAARGCDAVQRPQKTAAPTPIKHAASKTGRYVSENGSSLYHPEGCFHVKGKTSLRVFDDADEADLSGRTPAQECRSQ